MYPAQSGKRGRGGDMNTIRRWGRPAAALAMLLVLGVASSAVAQTLTATLTGTVQDKEGGVLKGASVRAVSQTTGIEYATQSNEVGIYTISGLPIGSYVLSAEANG